MNECVKCKEWKKKSWKLMKMHKWELLTMKRSKHVGRNNEFFPGLLFYFIFFTMKMALIMYAVELKLYKFDRFSIQRGKPRWNSKYFAFAYCILPYITYITKSNKHIQDSHFCCCFFFAKNDAWIISEDRERYFLFC